MKLRYSGKYTKHTMINLHSVGEETNISHGVNGGHSGEYWVCELGAQVCSCWNSTAPRTALRKGGNSPAHVVWMRKYLITVAFILLLFPSSEKFQFPDRKALYCCCHWLASCHFKHPQIKSSFPLCWLTSDWKQWLEGEVVSKSHVVTVRL